jgi:hypothetical protein
VGIRVNLGARFGLHVSLGLRVNLGVRYEFRVVGCFGCFGCFGPGSWVGRVDDGWWIGLSVVGANLVLWVGGGVWFVLFVGGGGVWFILGV